MKTTAEEAVKEMMALYESIEQHMSVIFPQMVPLHELEMDEQIACSVDLENVIHCRQLYALLSYNAKQTLDQLIVDRLPEVEEQLRNTPVKGNTLKTTSNPRKLFAKKRVLGFLGKQYGRIEARRIYNEIKKYFLQIQ